MTRGEAMDVMHPQFLQQNTRESIENHPALTSCSFSRNYSHMSSSVSDWRPPENVPLYTIATVERAIGVTKNNLRLWMFRGHIALGEGDAGRRGKGVPTHFSLRTILILAVTAELVRCGSTPKSAFDAAENWMLFGDIEGEGGAPARREPGGLYPKGWATFLVVAPALPGKASRKATSRVRAVRHEEGTVLSVPFGLLFSGNGRSSTIVWLNAIDTHVRQVCAQDRGDVQPQQIHSNAVPENMNTSLDKDEDQI